MITKTKVMGRGQIVIKDFFFQSIYNFRILLFLIFYLIIQQANGQNNNITEPEFKIGKNNNFIKYVDSLFNAKYMFDKRLWYGCETGSIFAKFQIDSVGHVINLKFTYDANKDLVTMLQEVIEKTDGYWKPKSENGHFVNSKYFVIPIYYSFSCKNDNQSLKIDKSINGVIGLQNFDKPYNFAKLYDSSDKWLDCILLHPLFIKGPIK